MPVTPDTFADNPVGNTPITAAKLNNIEQAIVADDATNPASASAIYIANQLALKFNAGTADATIGGYITTGGTATKTALDAAYFAAIAYVPAATGVFATDTANILAAVNRLPVAGSTPGGVVIFRAGQYIASLPDIQNINYVGQGRSATEIRCTSGVMLTTAAARQAISFDNLTLSTTAGHLIELGSGTTGISNGHIRNCQLVSYVTTSSLIHGTGSALFLGYSVTDTLINRPASSTVPAIDLTSSVGNQNANSFEKVTFYGSNSTAAPAVRIEATLGAYCHDNSFRDIVGEQNRGGLIHVYSPNGVIFESVAEWDGVGNYMDHIIKVETSTTSGGALPLNVSAKNVGTRFGTLNSASVKHFYCPTTPGGPVLLEQVSDPNGTSAISYIVGMSLRDAWGGSISFRGSITTNYTLSGTLDGLCIFNGTSVTASLPLPTALGVIPGRRFTIKNVNATVLTVNGTGGASIDGATSITLAQWAAKTFTTDGGAWYSV